MALSIVVVGWLARWDERRESAAALDEFAEAQHNVAVAAGAALATLLESARRDAIASPTEMVLASLRTIERRGAVALVVRTPHGLVTSSGAPIEQPAIAAALDEHKSSLRLSRPEAAALGLPARSAMVGLRSVDGGDLGTWGVAIVATAEHQRDREDRGQVRVLLSVALAAGLVLAFGGFALRKQRRQLELAAELAIAEARHDRDEQLVRADKLATMGALATGIAHEVSTPLGVIMGRAEQLLPKVAGDERAKRSLDVILEQSERISHVVRGFLRLARGGSPTLERCEPRTLAREAVQLVEHRFEKARVNLSVDVGPSAPLVACEPRLFEQALVNLLLNACDACDAGGNVELRVREDDGRVAFVVVDDGEGITPEAAARATQPFFTTKAPGEGTGLGLAIATEIAKHHQGSLTLGPREEAGAKGTRACIAIPSAKIATE
jgi:signal transduction histidine kinase